MSGAQVWFEPKRGTSKSKKLNRFFTELQFFCLIKSIYAGTVVEFVCGSNFFRKHKVKYSKKINLLKKSSNEVEF